LLFDDSFLRCGLCRHRDGNGFVPPRTNPSFFSIAICRPMPRTVLLSGNIIILMSMRASGIEEALQS
jgi:hypothetical protein